MFLNHKHNKYIILIFIHILQQKNFHYYYYMITKIWAKLTQFSNDFKCQIVFKAINRQTTHFSSFWSSFNLLR